MRAFQGDRAGGQAEAQLGHLVDAAREVGVVAGVQQVDDRGVGLGLGRIVGAGVGLDRLADAGLALVGGGGAGERPRTKVDDIGRIDPQAQLAQQVFVLAQEFGLDAQEVAHAVGVDRFPARVRRVDHRRPHGKKHSMRMKRARRLMSA
jgi:hypothetical protein